jgi:hypothetical protein
MMMLDAWNACIHGGSIRRAANGLTVAKWIGEKPGLAPSFERWIEENASSIPATDLMAGDWEVVNT